MYNLIIEIALMVSLGVIVYLVGLAASRTTETNGDLNAQTLPSRRWGALLPLDEIDSRLIAFKDKVLRRIKVVIMKIDNFISKRLNNGEKNI